MKTILSAGVIALAAGSAFAGTVQLGVTPVSGTQVMNARYRGYTTTDFEQGLAGQNGVGTSGHLTAQLANPMTWNFSISHEAGQGFTYTVSRNQTVSTLTWRDDAAATSTSKSLIAGQSATGQAYNSLVLIATAREYAGRSMTITNLNFTAAGQTITGALGDLAAVSNGGTSVASTAIVSSTDMRSFNWTLTGTLAGFNPAGASANISERIKFDVRAEQGNYVIVPLPAGAWAGLGGLGLLGVAQRIRRRRQG